MRITKCGFALLTRLSQSPILLVWLTCVGVEGERRNDVPWVPISFRDFADQVSIVQRDPGDDLSWFKSEAVHNLRGGVPNPLWGVRAKVQPQSESCRKPHKNQSHWIWKLNDKTLTSQHWEINFHCFKIAAKFTEVKDVFSCEPDGLGFCGSTSANINPRQQTMSCIFREVLVLWWISGNHRFLLTSHQTPEPPHILVYKNREKTQVAMSWDGAQQTFTPFSSEVFVSRYCPFSSGSEIEYEQPKEKCLSARDLQWNQLSDLLMSALV